MSDYDRMQRANEDLKRENEELRAALARLMGEAEKRKDAKPE